MKKKQSNSDISPLGCLGFAVLAITPGLLLAVAIMNNLAWLFYLILIPMAAILILFLLSVLVSHSKELKAICDTLLLLIGLGFLFDLFFGGRK